MLKFRTSFLVASLLYLALLGVRSLLSFVFRFRFRFGFGFGFGFGLGLGLGCTQVMRVLILESSTAWEDCLEFQYSLIERLLNEVSLEWKAS